MQITSRDIMKLFISCPMPYTAKRGRSVRKDIGHRGLSVGSCYKLDCVDRLSTKSFFVLATFVLHLVSTLLFIVTQALCL